MNLEIVAVFVILGYITTVHGHKVTHVEPWYVYSEEYNSYNEYHHVDHHPCKRECIIGQHLTCYYEFIVHYYEVAGRICSIYNNDPKKGCILADGIPTGVIVANSQLAGPSIEVCENDTIIVDVINNLREGTTIHWHGIHMRKTPDMDGAPYTTQYPINPGESYRYKFEVSQHGTFWWHSHMSFQRAYGLAGPLTVREPTELNHHAHLYEYDLTEHTIYLSDWFYNYTFAAPKNVLINGKGHNSKTQFHKKHSKEHINYERFKVVQGLRYRFRVIYNGNANCPLEISIDKHHMQVISSDANDMEPVTVTSLIILAAERFDIVLYASAPIGNYWIRVKGRGFCEASEIHQAAIIQYEGAPEYGLPRGKLSFGQEAHGLQLNSLDLGPSADPNKITMDSVNSIKYTEWQPNQIFKTYYTSLGLYSAKGFFGLQMDNIYFEMPAVSTLQARDLGIEAFYCNKSSLIRQGKNCKTELCKCFNLIQVPAYDFIEFVVSSEIARGHPFHPHGIDFRVVGMGVLGPVDIKRIEEIDKKTPLKRRLDRSPAIKDTVQVPGNGYAIIRFYSDNPGFWMFHCHLTVHSDNGMMSILKIGENHQMVPTPRNNCYEGKGYPHEGK